MSDITGAAARAALAHDPLLGPLVRHHPDVDLVLLPPLDSAPADPTPAELARRAVTRVESAVDRLTQDTPGDWAWGDPVWWNCGDRATHRYVVRGGLRGLPADGVTPVVDRVEAGAGLLVDDDLRIHLTPHATGVDVRIEGALLHLAPETFDVLTRELRERLWLRQRAGGGAR